MKNILYIACLSFIVVTSSCESREEEIARLEFEEFQRKQSQEKFEKTLEKTNPEDYLIINNNAKMNIETNLWGKVTHYEYSSSITNNAKFTEYKNPIICFKFMDNNKNLIEELCYEVSEIINLKEIQKFNLKIAPIKNNNDFSSFHAYIKEAKPLEKVQ